MPSKPIDAIASVPTARAGTLGLRVLRSGIDGGLECDDTVAVEAPLEFQLHHPALGAGPVSFGATMRTPGDDAALAAGLLYGEGLIEGPADIDAIETSTRRPNVVNVRLKASAAVDRRAEARRFSAGSACGVCGTTGLDAAIARAAATRLPAGDAADLAVLLDLPRHMRDSQARFGTTGGIHAAAIFDFSGALLGIAEDVGRHNALDKLIGENLLAGRLPLANRIVLLSGRASFELVQKALRAGAPVLAAIGAPSSLAVQLSAAAGLTLVGFLRDAHCNVYTHRQRLQIGGTARSAN